MDDAVSEEAYECGGELGNHAERMTWGIFETAPGDPNKLALRGYTRKSKRKFCAFADEGDWLKAEANAMAFLRKQGELCSKER